MSSHGGKRNRSGPKADESSERSERRDYKLTALPAEGYQGEIPDWPLAIEPTDPELEAWAWAWRTPQACAWSMASESWRVPFVAQWARLHVRCSDPAAPGNLFSSLFRLEDRIGLSTAGLAEMGWKVAVDELSERRADKKAEQPAEEEPPQRRMRATNAQS